VISMEKPDLYIVARFLDCLHDAEAPLKKTNLQLLVRMNYPRFAEYLEWMVEHQLASITKDDDGADVLVLSERGKAAYLRFVGWIRETMADIDV
jgi:predicted transcriptional regulator